MADEPLVTNESVVNGLGLEHPLTPEAQSAMVDQAIEATEAKVELFLNRPLVAKTAVLSALVPDDRYELDTIEAWPEARHAFDDRYRVRSYVENTTEPGTYDVTFAVGLDVANDPELKTIITFIREDSITSLSNNPRFTSVERLVKSVSADGQSISYGDQTGRTERRAAADIAGSPITLNQLKKWRRIPIFQRQTPPAPPWPYATGFGR